MTTENAQVEVRSSQRTEYGIQDWDLAEVVTSPEWDSAQAVVDAPHGIPGRLADERPDPHHHHDRDHHRLGGRTMNDNTTAQLDRSWLVQRLQRPFRRPGVISNPFSFGGGLRDGGLTKEAMAVLADTFSFDYMGSAEFEWGSVPKALQQIAAAHKTLAAGSFEVALTEVAPPFLSKRKAAPAGSGTVYWLAPGGWAEEVETRVLTWAREGFRAQLKESTNLERALRPEDDYDARTCGWLELDNGFFFFTDREMWERTCALFGVEVASTASASGGEG